jgi:hypothetical protein
MAFGIDDAIAAGLKVIDKFVPDPNAKIQAEEHLRSDLQAWDKQQTDVNAAEAANASPFVAGWRPAIGWACAYAFAFTFAIAPTITWFGALAGHVIPLPAFDTANIMNMIYGMLGMAGLLTACTVLLAEGLVIALRL